VIFNRFQEVTGVIKNHDFKSNHLTHSRHCVTDAALQLHALLLLRADAKLN